MAFNFLKQNSILFLFLFFSVISLYAHPHINVQAYSYNYFNNTGLQGVYMQWEFDPMFSSQLIYNYDINSDMSFTKDETAELKLKYFDNIVASNYYTYFKVDSETIKNPEPVSFKAVIDKDDEVIIMSFFIPLNIPYKDSVDIKYGFLDSTQYTAFFIPQSKLRNKGEDYKITNEYINKFGEVTFNFTWK